MGHYVTAVITRTPAVERILAEHPGLCSIFLRDGLHLIPLEDEDMDSFGIEFSPQKAAGFTYLCPELENLLAAWSSGAQLVYLETAYFGGIGDQAAIAWQDGVLLPPTPLSGNDSINRALASIGVVPTAAGEDEFEHVGLHRYRETCDWKEAAADGSVVFPPSTAHEAIESPSENLTANDPSAARTRRIDASNAVKISATGAALWWLAFGLPAASDILSPDPSSKNWIAVTAIYFGTFIGLAFYACLTVPTVRALRQRFASQPGTTAALAFWIFLPLLAVLAGASLILLKIIMNG